MKRTYFAIALSVICSFVHAEESREMLIVVSEPGELEYASSFRDQAESWQEIAEKGKIKAQTIGLAPVGERSDRKLLEQAIKDTPKQGGDLWLVWIGHGSFDGRTSNFNLRGGDIDSKSVADLLGPFERRLIILNLFSASAPFLNELMGENRIVISSTRSGGQRNYSRFGESLARSISNKKADMDMDGEVTLLEAVLDASADTEKFYVDAQRVVQENAVIEDNADGVPTPAGAFRGFRADMQSEESVPDGSSIRDISFLRAKVDSLSDEAARRRSEIEKNIHFLYLLKEELNEEAYFEKLEILMLEMAQVYGMSSGKK